MDRAEHWDRVYGLKAATEVSWHQDDPEPSLSLLKLAGAEPASSIVDIGGGTSVLVDHLIAAGFKDLTVLDLSAEAIARVRERLGASAPELATIVADVTAWRPERTCDVWHDRAALHFLVEPDDRRAYAETLRSAVKIGGHAVIGTFAPDGPEKCSGLPVVRHDATSLSMLLGPSWRIVDNRRHQHVTPWGSIQNFQFSTFKRLPDAG